MDAPKQQAPKCPGIVIDESVSPRSGGMGIVYKGHQTALARAVAVKVLHPDQPRGLLNNESTIAASVDHLNIVDIYEAHPDSNPPYFVMAWIEGQSLSSFCSTPNQDYFVTARIVRDIALALAFLHKRKLVHADVKPSNILVNAEGKPYLTDFGLSRAECTQNDAAPINWQCGTAPFTAPELYQTSISVNGPLIDIYALGVTLYVVLTKGDLIPQTAAPTKTHFREAIRLPREVNDAIPEPLQRICLKAMESEPRLRYQSAAAMAHDLDDFIAGKEILVRPSIYKHALNGRITNHIADLEEWHRESLIDLGTKDGLRQAYEGIVNRTDPWKELSDMAPWSSAMLRLGTTLVVLGTLAGVAIKWNDMPPIGHVGSVAGTTALLAGIGWFLYKRNKCAQLTPLSLIMFITSAFVFGVTVVVTARAINVLEFTSSPTTELFATSSTLDAAPNNWQLAFGCFGLSAYLAFLVYKFRHYALSLALATSLYPLFLSLFLVFDVKPYFTEYRPLGWSLLLVVPLTLACVAFAFSKYRQESIAEAFYSLVPIPMIVILTNLCVSIAWHYSLARDIFSPALHFWLTLSAACYSVLAWCSAKAKRAYVRRWSDLFSTVATISVLISTESLFEKGPELINIGSAPLTLWELIALLTATGLLMFGLSIQRKGIWLPADYALRFCFWRITWHHFKHVGSWPYWVLFTGMVVLSVPLLSMWLRSRRARKLSNQAPVMARSGLS